MDSLPGDCDTRRSICSLTRGTCLLPTLCRLCATCRSAPSGASLFRVSPRPRPPGRCDYDLPRHFRCSSTAAEAALSFFSLSSVLLVRCWQWWRLRRRIVGTEMHQLPQCGDDLVLRIVLRFIHVQIPHVGGVRFLGLLGQQQGVRLSLLTASTLRRPRRAHESAALAPLARPRGAVSCHRAPLHSDRPRPPGAVSAPPADRGYRAHGTGADQCG